MTTRRVYIAITVLCCLLTLATSAAAESAWVLWSQEANPTAKGASLWEPIDASSTEAGCRRTLNKAIEKARRQFDNPANVFSAGENFYAVTVPNSDGEGTTRNVMYLRCLPDSIDPRGPKGK